MNDQIVPLTSEPHHHPMLQNEYVRVFRVEVAPHSSTLLHQHDHDYIFVMLGDTDITNAVQDKPPVQLKMKDGEVRFSPAPLVHTAINNAGTPFRNITVEVLRPNKSYQPSEEDRGLEVGHGAMQEVLFVQDGVRATDVTINPGQMLHRHTHAKPYLRIAVSQLDLHEQTKKQPTREIKAAPGEFQWAEKGITHSVMNMAAAPARFIELEFE